MVSRISSSPTQRLMVAASLCWNRQLILVCALLDSGVEDNFVDSELVKQMGIPTELLVDPLKAHSVNGLKLFKVLHRTVPVPMIIDGNHQEKIVLNLIDHTCFPLVLGYSWLCQHNPQIEWTSEEICF